MCRTRYKIEHWLRKLIEDNVLDTVIDPITGGVAVSAR